MIRSTRDLADYQMPKRRSQLRVKNSAGLSSQRKMAVSTEVQRPDQEGVIVSLQAKELAGEN